MTAEQISALIAAAAEQAAQKLDAMAQKMNALTGGKAFELLLNTAQAEEKLAALRRTADTLLTDLNGSQTSASALALSQHNYKDAIRQLESLKSLSRTTYDQELAYLQTIRDNMRQYRLGAKDALDLEVRIADVQAEIMERDAQSLDTVLDGIISALSARYQAMRDAELATLDESRAAWKSWQQDSANAIQAQIDALDGLTQAEDRAAEEETHQRKIEKLTQALSYEQDDYNKTQIAAQLADAQAAYDDWRRQTAREDEKDALRQQLAAVDERTNAELEALNAQAEAVNAAYAQQMQAAALQAEAQQQLMNGSQQELLALITAYAPQYNAAGQTLGEQMLSGFSASFGSVESWVESLNAMIRSVQNGLSAAMQSAAESFYAEHAGGAAAKAVITQNNTFNIPVESPAETARRIRQANEELADQLQGA